ncbi:MAG TPA: YceI family protein [Dongiaceae bacterium]|nr:YceI family protein [Dongiaceae bacterium]
MNPETGIATGHRLVRLATLLLLAPSVFFSMAQAQAPAEVPTLVITPEDSSIRFSVKASVKIEGSFSKWNADLTFTSTDPTTGALAITIQADSVNSGSGMKDGKLKSKDFFYVEEDPTITFKSTKLSQTGPDTFEFEGDFTIRGVTKTEKLIFKTSRDGKGTGTISGAMAFDRKDYGMNKGIPLVKVADRVEVTVDLKVKHVGGPLLALPPVAGS